MVHRLAAALAVSAILSTPCWAVESVGIFGVAFENYARESHPNLRVDYAIELSTSRFHFYSGGFIESGPLGDRSFDVDETYFWLLREPHINAWIGRKAPLVFSPERKAIHYKTAIGSEWVQNQSNVFHPEVRGWTGLGVQLPLPYLSLEMIYSPVFLPNFGPRLELSEDHPSKGSRYAQIPPQYVEISGQTLPIRYQLDTGNLADTVFQNQFYISAHEKLGPLVLGQVFWSAPSPNPSVQSTAGLKVEKNEVTALVKARPLFERHNYLALTAQAQTGVGTLDGQVAYETRSSALIYSLIWAPLPEFLMGWLDSWDHDHLYSRKLLWLEWQWQASSRWALMAKWEAHLESDARGTYFTPRIQYRPLSDLKLYAAIRLISGQNFSYFGGWRSLDSTHIGIDWSW